MISVCLSNAGGICNLRSLTRWPASPYGSIGYTYTSPLLPPVQLRRHVADFQRWRVGLPSITTSPCPSSASAGGGWAATALLGGPAPSAFALASRCATRLTRGHSSPALDFWREEDSCALSTSFFPPFPSRCVGIRTGMTPTEICRRRRRRDSCGGGGGGGGGEYIETVRRRRRRRLAAGGTCRAAAVRMGRRKAGSAGFSSSSSTPSSAAAAGNALPRSTTYQSATEVYVIKPGDWVSDVAAACGVDVEDIRKLNPTVDLDTVDAGQEIVIPKTERAVTWLKAMKKEEERGGGGGYGAPTCVSGSTAASTATEVMGGSDGTGGKLCAAVRSDERRKSLKSGVGTVAAAAAAGGGGGGGEKERMEKEEKRAGFATGGQWPFGALWTKKAATRTGTAQLEVGGGAVQSKSTEIEEERREAKGDSVESPIEETDLYVMRRGDWVSSVAMDLGVPMDELRRLNPGVDLDNVRPKQKLIIPKISRSADVASSTASTASTTSTRSTTSTPSRSRSPLSVSGGATGGEVPRTCPPPPSFSVSSSSSPSSPSSSPSVCAPPRRGADERDPAVRVEGTAAQYSSAGGICPPPAGGKAVAKSSSDAAEICASSPPYPLRMAGAAVGAGGADAAKSAVAGAGGTCSAPPPSRSRAPMGTQRAATPASAAGKMCAPPAAPPVCSPPPAARLKEPTCPQPSCPPAPRGAPPTKGAQPLLREPRDGRGAIARGWFSLVGQRGRQQKPPPPAPAQQQQQQQQCQADGAAARQASPAGSGGVSGLPRHTELYKVRGGDVVESIAAARGVPVQSLLSLNPGVNLERLRVGQQIVVPFKQSGTAPKAGTAGTASSGGSNSNSGYVVYARHQVEPGDYLSEISERYGVSIAEIMKVNRMTLDDPIKVGQTVLIPFRKEVTSGGEGASWRGARASTPSTARQGEREGAAAAAGGGGGGGGGRKGDGRSVATVGASAAAERSYWSRVIEAVSPLQGLVLAGTMMGVGAAAAAGYVLGAASSSSSQRGGVMGRRVRFGREGEIPLGRGGGVGGGGGGVGGVRTRRRHREDGRGDVAMAAGTSLSQEPAMAMAANLGHYVENDDDMGTGGKMQGNLRIGDGYSAGTSLKFAISTAVESARKALGLAVATVAVVAVSGYGHVQRRTDEQGERESLSSGEDEGEKMAGASRSRKKAPHLYSDGLWNRDDDMIPHLCAVLPKPCALHGIAVTGLLAHGRPPAGESVVRGTGGTRGGGGGGGGGGGEDNGENEWAAVLLLSAPDGLVSATAMLGPGGALPAVQMAVSQMTTEVAGLKSLKAVVVNASPGIGHDILEMVVGMLPGVPAYAVMAGRGSPDAKGWLVPSKTGFGAAGQGVSLIGVTSEAEFGGAFLATVIGQWLYGPQCVVVARPPLMPAAVSKVY
ncbi:hypothetical protein CBR_g40652 [Chara braunii]|uniref:LysM domain-containing protein n=1 Tax=Chara braunii TaxID=69332 RepID=A0A388LUF1_CHABU|nr:hypothetical protein CBR_g40652 [Chara braunii]|eukprot:GBG85842.1 hypothetical protein CBR_g40652 [Chara braunii]